MLGVGHAPRRQSIAKSVRWLRPLLLAVLGSLLLAGNAYATEAGVETQTENPPPTEGAEKPAEPPPAEGSEKPAEPPPSEGAEKPAEPPPAEGSEKPAEPPPSEGAEKAAEPPPSEGSGKAAEPPPTGGETSVQGGGGSGGGGETTASPAPGSPSPEPTARDSSPAPASGPPDTIQNTDSLPYPTPTTAESARMRDVATPGEGQSQATVKAAAFAPGRGMRCVPSGLEERSYDSCTAGLSSSQTALEVSARVLATASADLAATGAAASGEDDYGGSANAAPPANQAPAGPPSSGSGAASAAGGSGFAPSGFLVFALFLLLATPHAMRRLRLRCEPWLTPFFVLIAERPD